MPNPRKEPVCTCYSATFSVLVLLHWEEVVKKGEIVTGRERERKHASPCASPNSLTAHRYVSQLVMRPRLARRPPRLRSSAAEVGRVVFSVWQALLGPLQLPTTSRLLPSRLSSPVGTGDSAVLRRRNTACRRNGRLVTGSCVRPATFKVNELKQPKWKTIYI